MAKKVVHKVEQSDATVTHRYFFHAIIFAFSFLLYFNSTFNSYNLDDELVTQNHRLTSKGLSAIPEIFNSPYYADEGGYRYEYRPLVLVSFTIEHVLLGENAFYSHLVNLILYALACLLLYQFLKTLLIGYNTFIPFIASLFFVAHPVHTEVVDSIKNRDEIFVLLFGLSAMYSALLFADSKKVWWLVLSPVFMLLAMLAKPTAAVFAFITPFALLMFRANIKYRQLALVAMLLYLPAVVYSRIYFLSEQVGILAGLLFALFVLNSLKNRSWTKLKSTIKNTSVTTQKIEASTKLPGILFWLFATTIAVTLTSIATVAVLMPVWWLFITASMVLLGCWVILNPYSRVVILPCISILVSVFVVRYHILTSVFDASLLIVIAVSFISGNRLIKVAAVLSWCIYAVCTAVLLHSFFALAILLFAVIVYRKLLPLTLLMALGISVAAGFSIYGFAVKGNFNFSILSMLLLLSVLGLLWYKQSEQVSKFAVWLLPVSFAFLFTTNSVRFTEATKMHVDYQLKAMQFTRGVDLTPANTYRPLKFIEMPVTELDKWEIRLGTAMNVLGKYLKLVIIPYPLQFYYGYPYISATSIFSAIPLLVFLIHMIIGMAGLYLMHTNALLSFSLLFYLASISIFSTLLVPIPGMLGDRFLLLPSLGFCLALTSFLFRFVEKNETESTELFNQLKPVLRYSVLGVLLAYSTYTFVRNTQWKDHVTLFSHDLAINSNTAQGNNLLGLHLLIASNKEANPAKQLQMRETAIQHFKTALQLYPKLMNAAYDMARCYDVMGKPDEAYNAYKLTTQIDSSFYAPYFSLALYEHNSGDLAAAVQHYEKFIRKYPFQMEAYANLSFALFNLGQFENSIDVNRRALKVYPTAFEAMVNIGKTFYHIHKYDSALYYFEKAKSVNPNNTDVMKMIEDVKSNKAR